MNETDKVKAIEKKIISINNSQAENSARLRVNDIFDKDSFFELNSYVTKRPTELDMDFSDAEEGVICGLGTVEGRQVYCFSQDISQQSGSIGKTHADKICETIHRAVKSGLPLIGIYDTKGAKVMEGIEAVDGYARIMSALRRASGEIPVISYIAGECSASAAVAASLSDFVIITEGASLGIVSKYVLQSSFGEKAVYNNSAKGCFENGKASFYEDNSNSAAFTLRKLIGYLPDNNLCTADIESNDDINRLCPDLNILAESGAEAVDIRQVIHCIADNNSELEVSFGFAKNAYTGFARLNGIVTAFLGLSDYADGEALSKLSKFVNFADRFSIPLIFITDCEGYKNSEENDANLLKEASALAESLSFASVPKITLVVGRAYGAGYILSMPKGLGADFLFAWPTARIGTLRPDTAVNILFGDEMKNSSNPLDEREKLEKLYEKQLSSPIAAARAGLVDDIIIPSDTRKVLLYTLSSLMGK